MKILAIVATFFVAAAFASAPAEAGVESGAQALRGAAPALLRADSRPVWLTASKRSSKNGRSSNRYAMRGSKHRHRSQGRRYFDFGWAGSAFFYDGVYEGAYGPSYGPCEWIYHRAMATNSLYFWNRFGDCMGY